MKKSPRMPPSPFGSGQLLGCGSAENAAASISTATGQIRKRARRRSGTVEKIICQPQAAIGRKRTIEARPRDWMDRSASTAPHQPRMLRGAVVVALLKLGSYTDHVARLAHAPAASTIRASP